MSSTEPRRQRIDNAYCSIARTVDLVGDRWRFLILREALLGGVEKYADFERALGIAPNVLADRLNTLVEGGILEKRQYREAGARPRYSYHPTPAGAELKIVLAALQQWGDGYCPPPTGATIDRETIDDHRSVRVGFIDDDGRPRDIDEVTFVRSANYPSDNPR